MSKLGTGYSGEMTRRGFRELGNAFNPSRESVADHVPANFGEQPQQETEVTHSPEQQRSQPQSTGMEMNL